MDFCSENRGPSNGEARVPVAFLLSFLPPGSHLGPEELVQSILLPAFAETTTSGAHEDLDKDNPKSTNCAT